MLLLAVLCTVSCKEDSPSESTVKKDIKERIASCKVLTVDSFHKLNGIKHGEQQYEIKGEITISYTPTEEMTKLYKQYKESTDRMRTRLESAKPIVASVREELSKLNCANNVRETNVE